MSAEQCPARPKGGDQGAGWGSWLGRWWSRLLARVPLGLALAAVTAVWAFGAVWSFTEQSAFARAKGFSDPTLLPLVLDGLAVAMAGVAFAASMDARPAIGARFGTALAVAASATSNGLWAAERSTGPSGPDWTTVAIGAGIPIAANIAFEVLLGELRRQVQRRRGLPAPVALPTMRVLRLVLAPRSTFQEWRAEVLTRTAPALLGGVVAGDLTSSPGALYRGSDWLAVEAAEADADEEPEEVGPAAADELAPQRCLEVPGPARPALPGPPTTPPPTPAPIHDGGSVAEGDEPAGGQPRTEDTGEGPGSVAQPKPEAEMDDAGEVNGGSDCALPGDTRVRLLRELLDAGAAVTGAQAAVLLSHTHAATSGRTGRRLLAEARQPLASSSSDRGAPDRDETARTGTEHSPRPAVPLSLVPRPPSTPPAGELP